MNYHNIEIDEVLKKLKTTKDGLTTNDANKRIKNDGYNIIESTKKKSKIILFLKEFNNLMIIILFLSALISFIISLLKHESFIDSIIIIVIVIINAILGFIQELKADKAMEMLKKMQTKNVKVKRDNKIQIIDSKFLVKGDIIVLEAGDNVPADARIFYEASLKVDESALTGESFPVSKENLKITKNVSISERTNMIYLGTNIVYGKCQAVVCETGMNTEFGHIASKLQDQEKEITPLQEKINDISKFLSLIIAIIIGIMFIVGLIKGMNFITILMLSISLAVAAIPEGLPAVITITLSLGVNAMAKKKAIVRKMASVETLGCTEIICSDKTGTITQNKMTVKEVMYNNKIYTDELLNKDNLLLKIMALNNDAIKNNDTYIGDPTEIALYEYCEQYFNLEDMQNNFVRIDELPFDSDRKMMSTINKSETKIIINTKGSFDSLIKCCNYVLEDEKIVKLTDAKRKKLKEIEIKESNKAYRILAYAYKEINIDYKLDPKLESDLIFVGMTAMIDPPREDVKEAISLCKTAHIKPIMITGDSLSTAISIAKEIGILENENEAIVGTELDKMNELELKENVLKYSVYARVSPMNKLSIVNAIKDNGKIVAMTGDGVNDAPALKSANIGVGMGITGTEVSKNVSDIVLADDSFSTIVTAVQEGRRIFDNIRNVLVYLLTGNFAEIIVVFISMLFGIEIFLPIHLLYINLITDSIPAIALAFEKEDKNIMKRKIRKNDSSFFTPFLIAKIIISSILKSGAILIVFFTGLKMFDINVVITMSFLTIILIEILYAYSCRNLKSSIINKNIFTNSVLNKNTFILIILQLIIFLSPLKNIFNITTLNISQISFVLLISLITLLIDEFLKKIIKNKFKD